MRFSTTLVVLVGSQVAAFPLFRELVPNGFKVPNPDPQGGVWTGVGHVNPGGGGPRNQFGLDFKNAGFKWTKELCETDSDGDGRSNGVELGDPDCLWQQGLAPSSKAQSHPGIPDQPKNISDTCEHYVPPEDVFTMELKFSDTSVLSGNKRTSYRCEQKTFMAPIENVTDYNMIRWEPEIDNSIVLHHTILYDCTGTISTDGNRVDQGAYECDGMEVRCDFIFAWGTGETAVCEPPNVGKLFEFGPNGRVLKFEFHYDNARLQNETDHSAMIVKLTPTLRPLQSGQVRLGPNFLASDFTIPAGQKSVPISTICPVEATMKLPHPIWGYSWFPHMHYYGNKHVTEHYRCGKKIGEIGNIKQWDFDNQLTYALPKPIKILPGDVLTSTCVYDTSAVTGGPIVGGSRTNDEMCFNFVRYYPALENNLFASCVAYPNGVRPMNAFIFGDSISSPTDSFYVYGTDPVGGVRTGFNYSTDPTTTLPACCDDDSCEEMYLSDLNGPCGADDDCKSGNCDEVLCAEAIPEETPGGDDPSSGACRVGIGAVALIAFLSLF